MNQIQSENRNNSSRLLIFMGVLWLLLAAGLLFYQLSNPATIKVEWETATEIETAGFRLYRSQSPDTDFTAVNEGVIPSKGDTLSGATYTYIDDNVTPGETYYYVLEEIEFDSTTNRYEDDMFSYKVPQVTWWVIALTAASVLVGLALLVTGLKENRNG